MSREKGVSHIHDYFFLPSTAFMKTNNLIIHLLCALLVLLFKTEKITKYWYVLFSWSYSYTPIYCIGTNTNLSHLTFHKHMRTYEPYVQERHFTNRNTSRNIPRNRKLKDDSPESHIPQNSLFTLVLFSTTQVMTIKSLPVPSLKAVQVNYTFFVLCIVRVFLLYT